ncbi:MAG TPA: flagellar FlbD family protein [Armatimonadota bacterium]|jgi:flagellar protein FlbD
MISVTRLNGEEITINADLIEFIEARPDTVITLTTGHRVMAKESVSQIIKRVVAYERAIRIGHWRGKRRRVWSHAAAGDTEV